MSFEIDEKLVDELIEKHTYKTPVNEGSPDHFVWLNIGSQHFRICGSTETAKQADWYRRQLAIALSRLLKEK